MPEQTDIATRIVRARDLKPGDVILRHVYDVGVGSHKEQQVVLDIETTDTRPLADLVPCDVREDYHPDGECPTPFHCPEEA